MDLKWFQVQFISVVNLFNGQVVLKDYVRSLHRYILEDILKVNAS